VRRLIRAADPDGGRGGEVGPHAGRGRATGSSPRRDLQGRGETHLRQGRVAADPAGLFNSSLDGNTRRAIDIRRGDKVDEKALQALVRAAIELNTVHAAARPKRSRA
jgi:hypothetical protein